MVRRRTSSTAPSRAVGALGHARRPRPAPLPDRLRAHLRGRHRDRRRPAARLVPPGRECSSRWTSRSSPCSSCCRSSARASRCSSRAAGPSWRRLVGPLFSIATGVLAIWLLCAYDVDSPDTIQFVTNHVWIEQLGISWHLGVDGISLFLVVLTGILFPLALIGIDPEHNDKSYFAWILLLEAAVPGRVPVARPVPVLRLLRDHARPALLPDRRLGPRRQRPRRPPSSSSSPCLARPSCSWRSCPLAVIFHDETGGPLTFDLVKIAQENTFSADHRSVAVPRLRHRVRGEGAALPVAHLAARRPHRGADGRLGRPGRRHAEARHLRLPALRALPVPRGRRLGRRRSSSPSA